MTFETGSMFAELPPELPQEFFQEIIVREGIRVERIVSDGHSTPEGEWYDQPEDEWVLLLSGSAGILCEGENRELCLKAGDYVMIPAGCRHRVAWTDTGQKTVWLAVHMPKR